MNQLIQGDMFLQIRPLPLRPDRLDLPLVEPLHLLPLVLRRPRQAHEVSPRESPVLGPEELLHLVHVLHVQPERRDGNLGGHIIRKAPLVNRLGICDSRFVWIRVKICVFLPTVGGGSANSQVCL